MKTKRLLCLVLIISLILSTFNFKKTKAAAPMLMPLWEALYTTVAGIATCYLGYDKANEIGFYDSLATSIDTISSSQYGYSFVDNYFSEFYSNDIYENLDSAELWNSEVSELYFNSSVNKIINDILADASSNIKLYQEVAFGSKVVENVNNLIYSMTNGYLKRPGKGMTIVNNNPDVDSKIRYVPNDMHSDVLQSFVKGINNYISNNFLGNEFVNSNYKSIGEFYCNTPITEYRRDADDNYILDSNGEYITDIIGSTRIVGNIYSNYDTIPTILSYVYSSSIIENGIGNTNFINDGNVNSYLYSYPNSLNLINKGSVNFNSIYKNNLTSNNVSNFIAHMNNISVYTVYTSYYDDSIEDSYHVYLSDNILSHSEIDKGGYILLYDYINGINDINYVFTDSKYKDANIIYKKGEKKFIYNANGSLSSVDASSYIVESNALNINSKSKNVDIAEQHISKSQDYVIDKINDNVLDQQISIDDLTKAFENVKLKNIDIVNEKEIADSVIDVLTDEFLISTGITSIDDTLTNNPAIDDTLTNNPAVDDTLIDNPAIDKSISIDLPFVSTLDIPNYKVPASDLSNVFPFCLPFDLIKLVKLLKAEPKAPVINIPNFKMNTNYSITKINDLVIDLSIFDSVARLFRFLILLLVIFGLIKNANNFIGGGKT